MNIVKYCVLDFTRLLTVVHIAGRNLFYIYRVIGMYKIQLQTHFSTSTASVYVFFLSIKLIMEFLTSQDDVPLCWVPPVPFEVV